MPRSSRCSEVIIFLKTKIQHKLTKDYTAPDRPLTAIHFYLSIVEYPTRYKVSQFEVGHTGLVKCWIVIAIFCL